MRKRLMELEDANAPIRVAVIAGGRFGSLTAGPDNARPRNGSGRLLRRQLAAGERRDFSGG